MLKTRHYLLKDVLQLDLSKYTIKLSDYFVEYSDSVIKTSTKMSLTV